MFSLVPLKITARYYHMIYVPDVNKKSKYFSQIIALKLLRSCREKWWPYVAECLRRLPSAW